jgi:NAD-dependent dihydropyrimidine dehydrogenase PreA subunit
VAATSMCRIGRHEWTHKRNDEGQPYKECARCGQCQDLRPSGSGEGVAWGWQPLGMLPS